MSWIVDSLGRTPKARLVRAFLFLALAILKIMSASVVFEHSDSLLMVGEISMCDPRIVGETVYMLGKCPLRPRWK
ncbi:hypothetical protein CCL09_06565 [Pseudomonas congelans]|nr:hypothetical protein CCL09_06565 [Pseudomonas congelans]